MPDMSLRGSHLKELLNFFRFAQEDHVRKSRDHELMASTYGEAAQRLERALREEASKPKPGAEQ